MKIGIITFHWGANYGGVLQAYALQTFLENLGYDVQIINYYPSTYINSLVKCFITKKPLRIVSNIKDYIKNKKFNVFRNLYLKQTLHYKNIDELKNNPPNMDVYITGSDQVWNPYFLKDNSSHYFLTFGNENIKRISYAVSFGVVEYPKELLNIIKNYLNKFEGISVRENTGVEILKKININEVQLLPDPTLLLEKQDYLKLINPNRKNIENYIFFYALHKNQSLINKIYKKFKNDKEYKVKNSSNLNYYTNGIKTWISNIYYSKLIITNSFHGVAFSIIFKKDFIAIPVQGKGKGMNDRILTLLDAFDLKERILYTYNEDEITRLVNKNINWNGIDKIKLEMKLKSVRFFKKNI